MATAAMSEILHILSDFIACFGYGFTCIVAYYIYYRGDLSSINSTHPGLWRRAIIFLGLASFARLCSLLQVSTRLLWDLDTSLLTVSSKSILAVAVVSFISRLWSSKSELINMARVWKEVKSQLESNGDRW